MRPVWVVAAFLGCSAPIVPHGRIPDEPVTHTELADEDRFAPAYGKPELSKALIAERGSEATAERVIAELEAKGDDDKLRVATADLEVRRRFIASLEACETSGRWCPPRLDDPAWVYELDSPTKTANPPVEAPLRFDLESWRKVAAELHGRACACRTITCIDGVGVAIDELEKRPMADVQGDDAASVSITRARVCLFRLRGKEVRARAPRVE